MNHITMALLLAVLLPFSFLVGCRHAVTVESDIEIAVWQSNADMELSEDMYAPSDEGNSIWLPKYSYEHQISPLLEITTPGSFAVTWSANNRWGTELVYMEEALELLADVLMYKGRVRNLFEWQEDHFVMTSQELLDYEEYYRLQMEYGGD